MVLGKQYASRERKPYMLIVKQGQKTDWLFRGIEKEATFDWGRVSRREAGRR